MNDKLDIFKILDEKKNNEPLDVFEIMGERSKDGLNISKLTSDIQEKNQEHNYAPDFDLSDIRNLMESINSRNAAVKAASKPAHQAPVLKPAPAKPAQPASQAPAPKSAPAPTVAKPAPAPAPVLQPINFEEQEEISEKSKDRRPQKTHVNSAPAATPEQKPQRDSKRRPAPQSDSKRNPAPRPDKPPRKRRIFWTIIKAIVLLTAVTMFLTFVIGIQRVPSGSMAPLINNGDHVMINKTVHKFRDGDVIIYKDNHGQKQIGRIIASDGDVVDIKKNGQLYINNKLDESSYAVGKTEKTDENIQYPLLVSENEFFVLGDNRENAIDSRNYQVGELRENQISGKVIFCFKKIK